MGIHDEVSVMRRIPLFAHIDTKQLKLLAFTSERIVFEAEQMLFRQGDDGDAAYVVLDGDADVMVETVTGPVTVARLSRNALIGEIAILCDVPRTASIKAASRLETVRITKAQFLGLLTESPQLAVEIMKTLAQRLAKTSMELSAARSELRAHTKGTP